MPSALSIRVAAQSVPIAGLLSACYLGELISMVFAPLNGCVPSA